ncbi:Protein kinase-like domain [Pseudocohnilembus persalinus]|uniref:Protein kinase-like domain n=1 Tax=Pseudocohnilembus persalinus TaxID=266149 RepID=A0A0V0QVT2_PSEPJ|nr:Protein kinase-like domain [Pseudocohnilembus persalinus]|eukprot:KRX06310.1 Protein kinase-like domain [Pseudocohnilembus persalinus]
MSYKDGDKTGHNLYYNFQILNQLQDPNDMLFTIGQNFLTGNNNEQQQQNFNLQQIFEIGDNDNQSEDLFDSKNYEFLSIEDPGIWLCGNFFEDVNNSYKEISALYKKFEEKRLKIFRFEVDFHDKEFQQQHGNSKKYMDEYMLKILQNHILIQEFENQQIKNCFTKIIRIYKYQKEQSIKDNKSILYNNEQEESISQKEIVIIECEQNQGSLQDLLQICSYQQNLIEISSKNLSKKKEKLQNNILNKNQLMIIAHSLIKMLYCLHSNKIYLRDIIPQNIVFDGQNWKFNSFDNFQHTNLNPENNRIFGGLNYMMQDQALYFKNLQGWGEISLVENDLYALGVCLYKLKYFSTDLDENYLIQNSNDIYDQMILELLGLESVQRIGLDFYNKVLEYLNLKDDDKQLKADINLEFSDILVSLNKFELAEQFIFLALEQYIQLEKNTEILANDEKLEEAIKVLCQAKIILGKYVRDEEMVIIQCRQGYYYYKNRENLACQNILQNVIKTVENILKKMKQQHEVFHFPNLLNFSQINNQKLEILKCYIDALDILGNCYKDRNMLNESKKYYAKMLEIKQMYFGENNRSLIKILQNKKKIVTYSRKKGIQEQKQDHLGTISEEQELMIQKQFSDQEQNQDLIIEQKINRYTKLQGSMEKYKKNDIIKDSLENIQLKLDNNDQNQIQKFSPQQQQSLKKLQEFSDEKKWNLSPQKLQQFTIENDKYKNAKIQEFLMEENIKNFQTVQSYLTENSHQKQNNKLDKQVQQNYKQNTYFENKELISYNNINDQNLHQKIKVPIQNQLSVNSQQQQTLIDKFQQVKLKNKEFQEELNRNYTAQKQEDSIIFQDQYQNQSVEQQTSSIKKPVFNRQFYNEQNNFQQNSHNQFNWKSPDKQLYQEFLKEQSQINFQKNEQNQQKRNLSQYSSDNQIQNFPEFEKKIKINQNQIQNETHIIQNQNQFSRQSQNKTVNQRQNEQLNYIYQSPSNSDKLINNRQYDNNSKNNRYSQNKNEGSYNINNNNNDSDVSLLFQDSESIVNRLSQRENQQMYKEFLRESQKSGFQFERSQEKQNFQENQNKKMEKIYNMQKSDKKFEKIIQERMEDMEKVLGNIQSMQKNYVDSEEKKKINY